MRINATIILSRDMTKGAFIEAIEAIPEDAKMSVKSYAGDRPFESGTEQVNFTWER